MRKCCILISLLLTALNAMAQTREFCIAKDTVVASIVVDESDWAGVKRAATDLSADINRVTGIPATILSQSEQPTGNIIVGTIGKSKTIDKLIKKRKLNVDKVRGEWESYIIEVIDGNLVIAGSDKRGTIYGI
ncbi:MAG: glycosyhydrolase, partial [Bacteroidaceae bacterium]|nr:glycosyhydrolase [Bacteroidaceae bacterium]